MKSPRLFTWLAAALFSGIVVIPFIFNRAEKYKTALEFTLATATDGTFQIYWDEGEGFVETASVRLPYSGGNQPRSYRLLIPARSFNGIRIDPVDQPGAATFDMAFITPDGTRMPVQAEDLAPVNEVQRIEAANTGFRIVPVEGGNDPQVVVRTPRLLRLTRGAPTPLGTWLIFAPSCFVIVSLILLLGQARRDRWLDRVHSVHRWVERQPLRAFALGATVGTILSAYPVVFLGHSFVSPNLGPTQLTYERLPTLAGYKDSKKVESHGSDVGAIMWAFVPYGPLHREAYLQGDLPLWNRYNSCGTTLIGQGQSMVGDPFMALLSLVGEQSWAWDLRYLFARWYFAFGLALCAWIVSRHVGASLLVATTAVFIGFFNYRLNHPAIFSMCAAPWILLGWLMLSRRQSNAAERKALLVLLAGNCCVLTSGTIKEAYMLIVTMNLSGIIVCLFDPVPWKERVRKLLWAALVGAIFVAITSPSWFVFLRQLQSSYTSYNVAHTAQIQPSFLLGFIDELFYRPLSHAALVFNPSINLLFFFGFAYVMITLRHAVDDRRVRALLIALLVPLAFAFGLIPPEWIVATPFLGNVAHVDNSFSCGAIILIIVLSAVGFAAAARRLGTQEGPRDILCVFVLFLGIVWLYIAANQAVHRSVHGAGVTFGPIKTTHDYVIRDFVWWSLISFIVASAVGAWVLRNTFRTRQLTAASVLLLAACLYTLLWRNADHAKAAGTDPFISRLGPRVDFNAKSAAVDAIRATQGPEPTRALGLKGNIFPGWNTFLKIEGIHGPDALMNPLMRELITAGPVRRIWDWRLDVTPTEVAGVRHFLDFLNVRYYADLGSDQALMAKAVRPVLMADLDVYESDTYWPRAFFTNRIQRYSQVASLVSGVEREARPFAAFRQADLADPAYRDVKTLPAPATGNQVINRARDYTLSVNGTTFTVDANGPGVAVLQEVFQYGDFRATLDGRDVPVLRVNHAFRGVYIPQEGSHTISIWYHPRGYTQSLIALVAGLFLAVAAWIGHRRLPENRFCS